MWTDFLDWKYLVVFLSGIFFGILFLSLLYIYSVIVSLNRKNKRSKKTTLEIDQLEIQMLIDDAKTVLKDKEIRKEVGLVPHLKTTIIDLTTDISKKYYPTSKYPLLELTLDETLKLTHYVSNRVDELMQAKILTMFRNRTLAQIKSLYDTKTKISDTKVVKVAGDLKTKRIGKTISGALNALNPAYWIKKVTVDKLTDLVIMKICLQVVQIVGEETYKIYSKSVFRTTEEDFNIDELYEEIKKGEIS
ncbi:MAG: hypothetical protein RBQ63_01200 [Acholeplasmatales bacterium]|nr:hypothetical protein [Acholeplasmatales bacterium]